MKFRYKKYGETIRPVIPVVLRHKDRSLRYEALVDSGADLCIFHAEAGEYLGIDVKRGRPLEVFGVGGKVSLYYLHKIIIEVGGCPFEIEAGFMPGVSGQVMSYGVLGQRGFFNLFKAVKFDFHKQDIEFKDL
mgnify:CR=1 FL=1